MGLRRWLLRAGGFSHLWREGAVPCLRQARCRLGCSETRHGGHRNGGHCWGCSPLWPVEGTLCRSEGGHLRRSRTGSPQRVPQRRPCRSGGTGGGAGEIAWLLELAKVSPLLTETIINMDKFFISQGIAASGLRSGLIKATNDMASALGLGDDRVNSITYALAQVQARGYLSGDELRQLANQFIPVWEALGTVKDYAGKSRFELRKLVEKEGSPRRSSLRRSSNTQRDTKVLRPSGKDPLWPAPEARGHPSILVGQAFLDVGGHGRRHRAHRGDTEPHFRLSWSLEGSTSRSSQALWATSSTPSLVR